MISKILIAIGTLIIVASVFGIIAGIGGSFYALKTNESAGIGAVGTGIWFALISNIAFFVGVIVLGIGCIKLYRERKQRK